MENQKEKDIETVENYDPKSFEALKEAAQEYLKFKENEQKRLIICNPLNVRTKRFGDEKLMLRLTILNIDGAKLEVPKRWDIGHMGLIEQLSGILAVKKDAYSIVVKRGPGQNKGTTYQVLEV
jgi:hypothetical protein